MDSSLFSNELKLFYSHREQELNEKLKRLLDDIDNEDNEDEETIDLNDFFKEEDQ